MKEARDGMSREQEMWEAEIEPVEQELLQAWAAAPAPGEDRVAGLSVSLDRGIPRRSRRRWGRAIVQHFATGALLFLGGYLVGQRHDADGLDGRKAEVVAVADPGNRVEPVVAIAPTPAVTTVADRAPAPAPVIEKKADGAVASQECKPPQVYQGKDGFFRIDTVLCQTGSQATWVINPRLEIANASSQSTQEDFQ